MRSGSISRRVVLISCAGALAVAVLLVTLGRRHLVEWLSPAHDPRRAELTLSFARDANGTLRCETRPYLRSDGAWLEGHEFSLAGEAEGNASAAGQPPDLGEVEAYLEYRQQALVPFFGDPEPLAVSVTFERDVPWSVVTNVVGVCDRLGIKSVNLDGDD